MRSIRPRAGTGDVPLHGAGGCTALPCGNAAPTFLSSCRKKSCRRSGGKERRFMSKACPLGRFGQIRELSWPVPCELAGPYRVRYTPAKQRTASPHLALRSSFRGWSTKGLDFWPRAFRFATRCLGSCSPPFGGVVQNRGPAGPLVWPFQGGPGGNRNPPGFLFRGRGGTLLFSKEKSPPSPRPPAEGRFTGHPSRGAYSYISARPAHGSAPRWGWCGCGCPPPPGSGW